MARITVEDCLGRLNNRFELVILASKRARDIALNGADILVPEENDKPTVLALREIAEGLIDESILAPRPQDIMEPTAEQVIPAQAAEPEQAQENQAESESEPEPESETDSGSEPEADATGEDDTAASA